MQDDLGLMQRVANGDKSAVAELYDRFGSLVYRMAYQLLPTKSDTEDAVQEIFVRLWQSAGRYNPERASLVTWVMLLTRRHLVDILRRRKVRPQIAGFDETWSEPASTTNRSSPDEAIIREEWQDKLHARIASLPELQREVIERAYMGGKTLREIGLEMNKPIGTIKSALSRALAGLRERVPLDEDEQ